LIVGKKRWVCFPPTTPRDIITNGGDGPVPSSIKRWFHEKLPAIKEDLLLLQQQPHNGEWITYYDFVQHPGETVYIPAGWHHAVLNEDAVNIAITHK
jgi:histone arginine demethylase JMJD6